MIRLSWFLLLPLYAVSAVGAARLSRRPLPDTAQVRQQLEATRRQLARRTDSAAQRSRELLVVSRRLHYPYGIAQSYLLLGMAARNQGEFDSSFYFSQRAQALFAARHNLPGLSQTYNLNAQNYKRMGDAQGVTLFSRKGLRQANQALATARQGQYVEGMVSALLSQGIIYRDLNQPDSARRCYQQAIALATRPPLPGAALGVAYANYGQLLMDFYHDLPGAIRLLHQALALHLRQHNHNGAEHAYRNLSWAYRRQHRLAQAVTMADSALALGRSIGDPHRLSNSLEAAYLAYRDAGRYREANSLMEEWKNLENQLGRLEKTQAVARIEAAYQVEKQQARIRHLAQENTGKQRLLWEVGAGAALLAGLLGLSYWQYRALGRANAQLRTTNQTITDNNQRIQEQARRLTLLMRELHHRVKNNLAIVSSLLNLQANRLTDPATVRAVREGQQRVEVMGLLHQQLYLTADVTSVDMRPYLTHLVESLMAAYGYDDDCFTLQLELDTLALNVDQAVPIGLIINELVTNSLKYAYAHVAQPFLRLLLTTMGPAGGVLLEVEDNGPGSTAGWEASTASFGKQLILALSAQLGGQVTTHSVAGTLFRLHVPAIRPARMEAAP